MKWLFLLFCIILSHRLLAQLPEDALRMSWTTVGGTAREQAIGGAMGSLGGEISAAFVNPAGLGFYKKGELVLSPGFFFSNSSSNYRGSTASASGTNRFNLGVSGLIFSSPGQNGNTAAFTIAVNRSANFNGNIQYHGQNNYSSFAEQYVEEFVNSGLSISDINGAIGSTGLSYGTRMALYTYLIDTATINGTTQVFAQPLKASLRNQVNSIGTRGGITEIAIGLASNQHDKWYIGGSLGIPIVNYTRNSNFTESDATGNTNNDFAFSSYTETYTSKGFGLNLKLGAIFKPFDDWRVGLAIHSPSIYALTDHLSASMVTNTENYTTAPGGQISISSDSLDLATGTSAADVKYDIISPWKFILSGSYVFSESADLENQKGFVTGDIEYVSINTSRFNSPGNTNNYFSQVNSTIKGYYKGSFDFRLGAEFKFNTLAVRAGLAYYTDPYKESDLKANRLLLSGGLGYRNKGIFVDLTYVEGFTKDVNFPYRLATKANTFATIKQDGGTLLLTIGFKFP